MTMFFYFILAVVAIFVIYKITAKTNHSQYIPIEKMIDHISVHGVVPFEASEINPMLGESCLLRYDNAQYYGFKTLRGVENVISMGSGTLYLTDCRIIFAGELRSVNILRRDIVRIQCTSSRLNIHTKNKQKPIMIYHPMAPVFEYVVKLLMNNALIINDGIEV